MVSDAELGPGAVAEPAGALATSAALDPTQLPPAGRDFARRFRAEYGRPPGRYGAYGYEAMAVICDSIDRASDPLDRAAVVDAFFATADRNSILGTYSIDDLGQTTLNRMTGYRLGGGRPEPAVELGVGG
jgi:branched-chain amino acid transport system substrate-binding protein